MLVGLGVAIIGATISIKPVATKIGISNSIGKGIVYIALTTIAVVGLIY